MKKTITEQHLDFVIRTKKKLSYNTYLRFKLEGLTDEEIAKKDIIVRRPERSSLYTRLYIEAVRKGFTRSFSYFYKYRNEYIKDGKLNF